MAAQPTHTSLLYRAARGLCRVATTTLLDLKVYGLEHVPPTGGVLLLSNHQSHLDPILVGVQLRRPVTYMAKSELFQPWGFGWLIRQLNAYPVRQGAGDVGAVKETIAKLKAGHLLTVFPEGTRTGTGEIEPLQTGFALIVRRAGVPIVPVAIDGAYRAYPRGTRLPRPTPVRVKFGPALDVTDLRPAEIVARVDAALHRLLTEVRSLAPGGGRGVIQLPVTPGLRYPEGTGRTPVDPALRGTSEPA